MNEKVRTAATEIIRQLEAAWNAHDGDAFGAAFTEDADFVDIRADHHRSRTAIAKGHQAILDTIYRGSKVRYELLAARSIADGVAVAHAAATLDAPSGPLAGTNRATFTMVLLEGPSGWRITAFQNTIVPPR